MTKEEILAGLEKKAEYFEGEYDVLIKTRLTAERKEQVLSGQVPELEYDMDVLESHRLGGRCEGLWYAINLLKRSI